MLFNCIYDKKNEKFLDSLAISEEEGEIFGEFKILLVKELLGEGLQINNVRKLQYITMNYGDIQPYYIVEGQLTDEYLKGFDERVKAILTNKEKTQEQIIDDLLAFNEDIFNEFYVDEDEEEPEGNSDLEK